MKLKIFMCLLVALEVVSGSDEEFSIVSRYPERPEGIISSSSASSAVEHFVKEGESVRLTCQASSKFNLCRWVRPPGHAVCGIFSSDDEKSCAREGDMSR